MPDHLHDTLPFLINRIAGRITESANHAYRSLGLNLFASRVLVLLLLDDARTVGELAERASLDQSTLSHILRRLEADSLLERHRLRHDNRSVLVELTSQGRAVAEQCWAIAQTYDKLLRKALDAAGAKALQTQLVRLAENLPPLRGAVSVPSTLETKPTSRVRSKAKPRTVRPKNVS